jgi:hypothetical protein
MTHSRRTVLAISCYKLRRCKLELRLVHCHYGVSFAAKPIGERAEGTRPVTIALKGAVCDMKKGDA